ncbi:MAG: aspartate aminotransferase family protein [Acidimicrobiales bacterium]
MSTAFWHPFADMSKVKDAPLTIIGGEGCHVTDDQGNRYLDATASLWYMNVGHGRQEIIDAIARQGKDLAAYSTFGDVSNRPVEQLAERLSKLAPSEGSKVIFVGGGGEAVDTASKLARRYFATLGQPERRYILHRHHGYHGTNGYGTSLAGIEANRTGFGDLIRETREVPYDDAEALEAAIVEIGEENVAAFIVEPVIGAGGVYPPPPGYLETIATICERHGVLLIVDSVICGFGRLGTYFAAERFGIQPDLITFAKGVTSGYLPLGGVIASEKIARPFFDGPNAPTFRHGPTYAGHPLCCAAALANLDILDRESLIERGADLEKPLFETLLSATRTSSIISDTRGGVGLLGAVELSQDYLTANPTGVVQLQNEMRREGVLVRSLIGCVAVSPPLIISLNEIEQIGAAFSNALHRLEHH